jgi:pimeloyl-ACP methyl ester carboxylesterase
MTAQANLKPVGPGTSARAKRRIDITTSDGVRLHTKDWGTGAPILFIHAWSMSSDFWEYQMYPLSLQGFRCVAYDRRGNGRSEDCGDGYDLDTLSDDLACVIDQLDLREVTLVGHSLGGNEIVRYLARHGSARVKRAVLVAGGTPPLLKSDDNPDGVDPAFFATRRAAYAANRAKWLEDNSGPFFMPDTSPGIINWTRTMMMQSSLRAAAETQRAFAETDLRPDLQKIDVPVMIIHGTADASIPIAFGRRTQKYLRDWRMIEYDGAPHGLPVTHAERLTKDIAEFASG